MIERCSPRRIREIKYFHPTGKPMPNGCGFQRGGYLNECRINKNAYSLDKSVHDGRCDNSQFMGGVVTLPTVIDEERYSEVVNMVKQAAIFVEEKIRKHRLNSGFLGFDKNEHVEAYSVGHCFMGRYVGDNGDLYDEKSLSVEVNGLGRSGLNCFAEKLAESLHLRSVLVKNLINNTIYFIDTKLHGNPFSMPYQKRQSILESPDLYTEKISRFSAGFLGGTFYAEEISIAELIHCWQYEEYTYQCPFCGNVSYITAWYGHGNGEKGFWYIQTYCPSCEGVYKSHFLTHTPPHFDHEVYWTELVRILDEVKKKINNESNQ